MRLVVIAALSCQQYLALSLISAAVPAAMRASGASLEAVGAFGLVFLAFSLNLLWAPIVDRTSLGALGRRRTWLVFTQIAGAILLALLAILDPGVSSAPVLVVGAAIATAAATQRVATLGFAAETLVEGERAWGAAALGWGAALGGAIGVGAGLALIDAFGWRPALLGIAGVTAASAALIPALREPTAASPERRADAALFAIARRPRAWWTILVIAPATFGSAVAFAMTQPRLVDLGFSLTAVGATASAASLLAATVAGPAVAGLIARRAPLSAVALAASLLSVLALPFGLADAGFDGRTAAILGVAFVFLALATQNVAFNALFLSFSRSVEKGTDVAFFTSLMSLIAITGFLASGFVAARYGYGATYLAAGCGYGLTALLAVSLRRKAAAAP